MSKTQISPAPWTCEELYGNFVVIDANRNVVKINQHERNAKLLAASPQLLYALEAMLSQFRRVDEGMVTSDYVKNLAVEAIKKANE